MKPGNIILLNGTTAVGKTTLAKELQKSLEEPYLHVGNDQFLRGNWPDNSLVFSDGTNASEVDGWLVVFQEGRVVDVQLGELAIRWLTGMYRAMAAWSEAGNHLVANVVLHDERLVRAAAATFHPLPAWYISVYCPVEVAEKREQADTGRALEPARLFHEGVYRYGVADLVVNTAASNPQECAQQIKQYMNSGSPPHAFRQLHRQFSQSP